MIGTGRDEVRLGGIAGELLLLLLGGGVEDAIPLANDPRRAKAGPTRSWLPS